MSGNVPARFLGEGTTVTSSPLPDDVYYCIRHFPGGVDALAEAFRPHLAHGLVQEGLQKIAEKFASPEHTGPKHVADFLEITDAEERELLERDAYERVQAVLGSVSNE